MALLLSPLLRPHLETQSYTHIMPLAESKSNSKDDDDDDAKGGSKEDEAEADGFLLMVRA